MKILIRGGHILEATGGRDGIADLYIADGRIAAVAEAPQGFSPDRVIDAEGLWVLPGLLDLQARLREPGHEHKGTIASETAAAVAGGITSLCCPPDTDPVLDNPAVIELIRDRSEAAGNCKVLPIGALTHHLAGEHLAEMLALREAGCVAVGTTRSVANTLVLRRALEYAATLGMTVFLHSEDPWLAANGCVHEGQVSTRLGLPGIPACAEVIGVSRDLVLIEQTGVRAHFSQLSSIRAVELVAEARRRGLPVSCDVAVHHLFLTEMDVDLFNSLCHVRPPLRTQRDKEGLRAALADGVISAICSDHQPHDRDAKLAPFAATEPGISGLETLLPLVLRLAEEGVLSRQEAIARVTAGPARVLQRECGCLRPGAPADLCIYDPNTYWEVTPSTLVSRGKNTPFLGWELQGRVTHTLVAGQPVFERNPA